MADNTPWRCAGCRQLRKHSANFCQTCQQPWQNVIDRTCVHQPGGRQGHQTSTWTYDSTSWTNQTDPQAWRTRSKSRTHTPRGRRSQSAKSRNQGNAQGPPGQYYSGPPPGKGHGKANMQPLPPMPPPITPWTSVDRLQHAWTTNDDDAAAHGSHDAHADGTNTRSAATTTSTSGTNGAKLSEPCATATEHGFRATRIHGDGKSTPSRTTCRHATENAEDDKERRSTSNKRLALRQ